jgi:hypothetical protein
MKIGCFKSGAAYFSLYFNQQLRKLYKLFNSMNFITNQQK